MSYVWISLQTRWQQQALQGNSKHTSMLRNLGRLADNSKFLAVLHCKGISNIHGFKCNCGLWLVFCADLRTTACTEWTFQTYISTDIWWASMWGFPCWLITNTTHSNDISNMHNYKEPMSYVRNSLQTCWQQQALWRNCKHTYLQKNLISYEPCLDFYACEPQSYLLLK